MIAEPATKTVPFLLVAMLLSVTIIPGCIEHTFEPECEEYPYDDRDDVYAYVQNRWKTSERDPDAGKADTLYVGTQALRTAPPDPPKEGIEHYMIWADFPDETKPAIVQDALCLTMWRMDNIPTITREPFATRIGVEEGFARDTLETIRQEQERQVGDAECCFILWQDQYFQFFIQGTTHQTP